MDHAASPIDGGRRMGGRGLRNLDVLLLRLVSSCLARVSILLLLLAERRVIA